MASSVTTRDRPTAGFPSQGRAGHPPRLARWGLAAVGIGLGYVVARDGTPLWQLTRLVVVTAVLVGVGMVTSARRPVLHAMSTLGVGMVAVPVGVGIAGPHVAKTGASLMSVAGVAALSGGLVLVYLGMRALLRMTHGWWRAPQLGAVAVVAVVLLWSLGQAVAATNAPRPQLGSDTPADAGLVYRDVEFTASDGVLLSGWYVPSGTGAAVVLLHGAGSTRSNVLRHAAVLAGHGYGVLLYDARGHGLSSGRAMDFGWHGDADVRGAVNFLEKQPDVDPARIGAVGMSMGGEQAIGAAARIDRIRAVVAEGATNRVAGDKDWLSDTFGTRGALTEAVDRLTYGFTDALTSASPPITLRGAVAAASPRPVLLVAGGATADEADAARFIRSGSPDTVDLWIVPGTGHTDALRTHPRSWESQVTGFLDDALATGAGREAAKQLGDR